MVSDYIMWLDLGIPTRSSRFRVWIFSLVIVPYLCFLCFRMNSSSACRIAVHVPQYVEVCNDGSSVVHRDSVLQLVVDRDTTNLKDLIEEISEGVKLVLYDSDAPPPAPPKRVKKKKLKDASTTSTKESQTGACSITIAITNSPAGNTRRWYISLPLNFYQFLLNVLMFYIY